MNQDGTPLEARSCGSSRGAESASSHDASSVENPTQSQDSAPCVISLHPVNHAPTAYLASLNPGSRSTQAQACENLARLASQGALSAAELRWQELRYPHVLALRAALIEQYAPRTVNRHLTALRAVLKQCWILGQLPAEDYQRAILVRSVRVADQEAGRALSVEELGKLWASLDTDTTVRGARDRALLRVLIFGGLRAAEVKGLRRDAANPLPVHGKGGKLRYVPLPRAVMAHVDAWLDVYRDKRPEAALFPAVHDPRGADYTYGAAFNRHGIGKVVRARARQAGLGAVTPHDCRRTYLTMLLDQGADPLLVAKLAGHSDVATTMLYDRRHIASLTSAVERCLGPIAA